MRIAFISLDSHLNVKTWSGTNYFMYQNIKLLNNETFAIGGLKTKYKLLQYFIKIKNKILFNRKYEIFRNPIAFNGYANQIEKFISEIKPDVIISAGSIPISALKTNIPIYIWSDATFRNLSESYPWYSELSPKIQKILDKYEYSAFMNANKIFVSSTWAKDSLLNDYQISESKVVELAFGANLNYQPQKKEVLEKIEAKKLDKLKFLFLAVEAERKGLDKVLKVLNLLKNKGIAVELNVVGCSPTIEKEYQSFTNVVGFISKSSNDGMQTIKNFLNDSTLLFVPSLFEAFGLVFAEASAHGLPSITSNVGGIPSVVYDGKNGYKFNLDEDISIIADKIIEITSNIDNYKELCRSSYTEYETRLNWKNSVEKLLQIIEQELKNK